MRQTGWLRRQHLWQPPAEPFEGTPFAGVELKLHPWLLQPAQHTLLREKPEAVVVPTVCRSAAHLIGYRLCTQRTFSAISFSGGVSSPPSARRPPPDPVHPPIQIVAHVQRAISARRHAGRAAPRRAAALIRAVLEALQEVFGGHGLAVLDDDPHDLAGRGRSAIP
jgi:hypothetical protein